MVVGELYSRKRLRSEFRITDASIKNGIFRPQKYDSVFLFVTEKKTPDRTQYVDQLEGNVLTMDGQTAGRTDYLILDRSLDLELLLFYRESVRQYSESAFRYEGPFRYVSHTGKKPIRFSLQRVTKQDAVRLSIVQTIDQIGRGSATALDELKRRAKGQGFKISLEARSAIENYAMSKAEDHFHRLGYVVNNVSPFMPYDLECRKDSEVLYVEVKGTQTIGERIILTSGEAEYARKNQDRMALFIMRSIRLSANDAKEELVASGGEPYVKCPWNVDEGVLDPIAYFYRPTDRMRKGS